MAPQNQRKKPTNYSLQDVSGVAFGNKDAEKAVVGAILGESTAFSIINDTLRAEMFSESKYGIIYRACMKLYDKSEVIDTISVVEQLRNDNSLEQAGGQYEVMVIATSVSSSLHIERHAAIICDEFNRRQMYSLSLQLAHLSADKSNDISDVIDTASSELDRITQSMYNSSNVTDIKTLAGDCFDRYLDREKTSKSGEITGICTGFNELDRISNGWQPGDFIILAARPAMGKTAVALHMARKITPQDKHALLFSLEMSRQQLADRMVISESCVDSIKFKNGLLNNFEIEQLAKGIDKISAHNIYIDDTAQVNLRRIKSIAKQMKKKGMCDIIMVDYLQLMDMRQDNSGYTREQEVSQTSRGLKIMAKELGVPVIALSQLSRAVEEKADKRPGLAHLRESGAIEQDADVVMFLWRPEYYDIREYEGLSTNNKIILDIAKARSMPVCEIEFFHDGQMSRFFDNQSNNSSNTPF